MLLLDHVLCRKKLTRFERVGSPVHQGGYFTYCMLVQNMLHEYYFLNMSAYQMLGTLVYQYVVRREWEITRQWLVISLWLVISKLYQIFQCQISLKRFSTFICLCNPKIFFHEEYLMVKVKKKLSNEMITSNNATTQASTNY